MQVSKYCDEYNFGDINLDEYREINPKNISIISKELSIDELDII
jgi:hypothetical protein